MPHSSNFSSSPRSCSLPVATAGIATIGGGATADIEGGSTAAGEVTMTVPATNVSSASKLSPARCVATVTAVGPPGDAAAENNSATFTIDVVDENDF